MNPQEHESIFLFEEVYFESLTPFVENPRAFTSLDNALKYMSNLIEDERTWNGQASNDAPHRRYVVRQFTIDYNAYPQQCIHAWEFATNGILLREEPEEARPVCSLTFGIGDIVEVLPRTLEPSSPVFRGICGTVVAMNDEEGDLRYRIYSIHKEGHLVEMNVQSSCLRLLEIALPDRMLFLRILSEHLKGTNPLQDSILQFIRPGDRSVLVASTTTYDFENKRVRRPYK